MSNSKRRTRWLLRTGFVIALGLTLFFGVRTTLSALYWHDPEHNDQAIAGWMPVGYIGRSWDLPREVVAEAVGVEPSRSRRLSIAQIAEERGVPVNQLIDQISTAIDIYRATHHD
ncbi:hypothetical protein [Pararhodobacter sp.]|uniref:hypothetical protein n=1 Tax=Pararhodobacter sp. TaxID=2127056 RepID=UPI002AFDDF4B|nr:hypothetical protein [Pararhodobacter sp.]